MNSRSRTNSILQGGEGRGGSPAKGRNEGSFFFLLSSGATALPYRRGSWTKTVRNVAYFSSHRGVSISGETSTGSNIASLPTPPRRPTSSPPPISACLFLEIAKVYENFVVDRVCACVYRRIYRRSTQREERGYAYSKLVCHTLCICIEDQTRMHIREATRKHNAHGIVRF